MDKQNSALQAKHEELSLQKDRLQKIQAEAEANERRVRELDTRLRMSEDANKALQASVRQHDANLEQSATEKSELRAALRRTGVPGGDEGRRLREGQGRAGFVARGRFGTDMRPRLLHLRHRRGTARQDALASESDPRHARGLMPWSARGMLAAAGLAVCV